MIGHRGIGLGLALLLGCFAAGCDAVRTFFPSSHHDEVAPAIPEDFEGPAILVFSKTNGFRHSEAIDAGLPALEALAEAKGLRVFATENGAIHDPELLARFEAIVWFNVSGNVLSEAQRAALLGAIESGTGFLGIHGTGGDPSYDWAAHPETLVRAQFVGHPMGPQFQEATIRVEAPAHPVMAGIGPTWTRVEEWYSFESSPRGPGVEVLATLDESTYSPRMKIAFLDRDLAMGDDHPIVWSHCIGRGRAIYSALGHQAGAYAEPLHLRFLGQAIDWVRSPPAEGCRVPAP
ncbi:MAG: ThuA domain-containing protein [Myxococcota bacterium]